MAGYTGYRSNVPRIPSFCRDSCRDPGFLPRAGSFALSAAVGTPFDLDGETDLCNRDTSEKSSRMKVKFKQILLLLRFLAS